MFQTIGRYSGTQNSAYGSGFMESLTVVLLLSQLVFTVVAGIYFFEMLRSHSTSKNGIKIESGKEAEKIKRMRGIHLSRPLTETARPTKMEEIIGQEEGVKALRAAICSPNPQHVLIYGPPGVGKTAAARLILEEAKKDDKSPFQEFSKFVEIDATTLRFDERSIADPLIGSVHDPIYQGAGAFGPAGVPQPKEGAVVKAHGGVLFIDEIGELHPIQMNKLLKVLEDRVVYFTSSYYNEDNKNIPQYIHDIFKNGLPADFRLIGATTRSPEEIPPALRSRCTEIFFDELGRSQVKQIAENSVEKTGFSYESEVIQKIADYSDNGRDTVNMVQTAVSVALMENRRRILVQDIEWVVQAGRYTPKMAQKICQESRIGLINGLAVYGMGKGALLEIEAMAEPAKKPSGGVLMVTGIVEEEEIKNGNSMMKRNSTARASVENALTVLGRICHFSVKDYDIHINFPGGAPVDGPSAGIAIFSALYSAVFQMPCTEKTAMTGEISIQGRVLPVGGVTGKIMAAVSAGAERVIIPEDNWQSIYETYNIEIVRVKNIDQVLSCLFGRWKDIQTKAATGTAKEEMGILTAEGM